MQRAVKTLQEFEFRNDFTIVEPPEPVVEPVEENISLTSSDLALLLSEARTEGFAAAQAQFAARQDSRLEHATGRLTEALANLVELAGHLEASAYEQGFTDKALRLLTATAQRIADGQGDLFAERAEFRQNSPDSPAARPEDAE
ncbi:MAG: hypothetical protein R3B98_01205 [Hyphomonas sp.]